MELIFRDALYDSEEWEEGKYSKQLASRLTLFDPDVSAHDTDIGLGASWPVVVIELFKDFDWSFLRDAFIAGTAIFLMGEKINLSLEAWLKIAKKLRKLFSKVHPIRIDEKAALVLAIEDLFKDNGQINIINVSIQIIPFNTSKFPYGDLAKRFDSLYIISIQSDNSVYIYGIKSKAKIEFKHEFSTTLYDF